MKATKQSLKRLFDAILTEVDRNPDFAERVQAALGGVSTTKTSPPRSNRRAPGLVDPYSVLKEGEEALRGRLGRLNVEELKDIVAENRMDSSRLVMKWKDAQRIIDHIVTTATARAKKGDAFFEPAQAASKGSSN